MKFPSPGGSLVSERKISSSAASSNTATATNGKVNQRPSAVAGRQAGRHQQAARELSVSSAEGTFSRGAKTARWMRRERSKEAGREASRVRSAPVLRASCQCSGTCGGEGPH